MILVGNQRGNSRGMANHLLKAENENVIVHGIKGFMGADLHSAFQESYAISRATQCSQHLYSLSLNPPKGEDVSTAAFEEAIERAEQRLGLTCPIIINQTALKRQMAVMWLLLSKIGLMILQSKNTGRAIWKIASS